VSRLSIAGVHKAFGSSAVLSGVDLAVEAGSFTAILGPSGSGKTTLLRIIAGFERLDRGVVRVDDHVLDDAKTFVAPEHRHIGYVPQEGSLFPHMTVRHNVAFGLRRGRDKAQRVREMLALVGLNGLESRYPHQLSGGQQQRVSVARALAVAPELVLLDEPFSSLDASLRATVRAEVREVLAKAGATVVLVTHDQDEALSLADRVAVIRDGRIGQLDAPHDLYVHPSDPDLATFVGDANFLPGRLDNDVNGHVTTALGTHDVHLAPVLERAGEGTGVRVLLRPEQLVLAPADTGSSEGPCATVREYRYYGHDALVELVLDGDEGETLMARVTGARAWQPGARVCPRVIGAVVAWPLDAPRLPEPTEITQR
jgi:iron(III) transport system ATP-binding protein